MRQRRILSVETGFALALATPLLPVMPAHAQEAPAATPGDPAQDAPEKPKASFFSRFFDEEDGKLDFSNFLAKGGFIPMPVIITEPAVDGGFGLVAQFITIPKGDPRHVTRRMLGAVKTGNGSYGYGYFQSGSALEGRVSYKVGVGRGKITLDANPRFLASSLKYTNRYDYGLLGSVLVHLADPRFSIGPSIDFRKLRSSLEFPGLADALPDLPDTFSSDLGRTLRTGAVGGGFHFDDRDNAMNPTEGLNAYAEAKFNSSAFGSDRNFQIYDLSAYAFHKFSPRWRGAFKYELDAVRGDYPFFFAPSIDIRGVQKQRYQGNSVLSSELELTRQLSPRWSLLAFAGIGTADAGGHRVFDDSGAVVAGGGGFRYRIARKVGLDAGIDVAIGPGGVIFYLQFGHAWGFGMD